MTVELSRTWDLDYWIFWKGGAGFMHLLGADLDWYGLSDGDHLEEYLIYWAMLVKWNG